MGRGFRREYAEEPALLKLSDKSSMILRWASVLYSFFIKASWISLEDEGEGSHCVVLDNSNRIQI